MPHILKCAAACIVLASATAAFPAKADCDFLFEEARKIARNITVTIDVSKPLSAGTPMRIAWAYRSMAEYRRPDIPTYVIITTPAEVRFAGKGFMALTAGAEAPYRMNYGRAGSRAFIPLHRNTDTAKSGEFSVTPYRAGIQVYGWAVVTVGACGEQVLSQDKRTVEVTPGAAQLVIQDRFSAEKPSQRIRSPTNTHELLIFSGRYEVHEIATDAKIVDRPGIDPNFSPTGRFVGAHTTDEGALEIFDLVSGTRVRGYGDFLAWARGDSFAVTGRSRWGLASVDNVIVDQGEIITGSVVLSCHACNAWDAVRIILDTDRGFIAAVGNDGFEISDLITRSGISESSVVSGTISEHVLRYIRQTYDQQYPELPKTWSLGERLELSHVFNRWDAPLTKTQLRFLVRHRDITTAKLTELPAHPEELRGRSVSGREFLSPPTLRFSNIFGRLSDAGIVTRARLPISHTNSSLDSYEFSGRNAQRDMLVADIVRRVPEAKGTFPHLPNNASCSLGDFAIAVDRDWIGSGVIDPDWITQAYQWQETKGNAWLIQAICYTGSGGFVTAADIVVVRESSESKKVQSILKWLGKDAIGAISLHKTNKVLVFRDDDQRIIVISPSGAAAAIINLETNKREGSLIPIVGTELISEARRTTDGRHLIQVNSDGRIFIYRIADGKRVIDGAYVDDEIVLMTEDGRYDTTYEGAYSVQVRFSGMRGLFFFSQFDSLLRRPGLANIVLGGGDLLPARVVIAPPAVEFTLRATLKDGQRTGRVIAASERELSAIRLYVDGRMVREIPVKGRRADVPIALQDPGGGRWVSVVAMDAQGLVSYPSGIQLPGPPRPRGTARVVAIGVDKYTDPNLTTLQSAVTDAKNFIHAVTTTEGHAFTAVHAIALLDIDVTPNSVLDAIRDAARATGPEDSLVIYFAGHGVDGEKLNQPDAGLILATNRTQLSELTSTSVRWAALAEVLSQSKGTVIVVLDACQSGIAGSEAFTSNDAVVSALFTKANAPIVVLAASKGRQSSQETDNGGVFTNSIVTAISRERTKYGVDRSGLIDLGELYSGVKERVLFETKGDQTPWLARNGLVGEMSLF